MIPSVTALIVSFHIILGTFFLSILGIKQNKPTPVGAKAELNVGDDDHAEARRL